MRNNGWTLPELRGQKLPVSVDFGTGSVTTAIVECGIVIMACSDLQGWSTFYKKCGPVPGVNSLDAGLGEGGMLMDNLCHWIDNCKRHKGA